jgi:hypothetical protein
MSGEPAAWANAATALARANRARAPPHESATRRLDLVVHQV